MRDNKRGKKKNIDMPRELEYKTSANPKSYAGKIPVFCAFDKIADISELAENPLNPNKHDDAQIKMLAEIIKATGWRAPITVSTRSGLIVKGHGRKAAAVLAGLESAPVDYQEYASESEEYADMVADNRIAELAYVDNVALTDVFELIDTGEVPFELSGYTPIDYQNIAEAIDKGAEEKEKRVCPNCGFEL